MTEDRQRIAIAEACGYVLKHCKYHKKTSWHTEGGFCMAEHALPDYLNDLNAMHEAEMPLGEFESTVYYDTLIYITGSQRAATFATASQRAEAFLKTIGKWEDEK